MAGSNAFEVVYNSTHPFQFQDNYSFENQNDVRIIYRAEPISILAGEATTLSFTFENPTEIMQHFKFELIDVPKGFTTEENIIEALIDPGTYDTVTVKLQSSEDIKPRSYWYAFDLVVEELGGDGTVSTQKRLGNYNGINILSTPEDKSSVEEPEEEMVSKGFPFDILLFLIGVLIVIYLIYIRTRKA